MDANKTSAAHNNSHNHPSHHKEGHGRHHHHGPMETPPEQQLPQRVVPERSTCLYTPCYCEENVWQLCKFLSAPNEDGIVSPKALDPYYVVFISNPTKSVLMFQQRAGQPPDGRCLWDYHVILVGKLTGPGKKSMVWDLDSLMDYPVPIDVYFQEALKPDNTMPALYRRKFRVVAAKEFYMEFASDRRHMKRPDGCWIVPPPPYEPVRGDNALVEHNLDSFIDVTASTDGSSKELGLVLNDAYQFLTFFSRSC